VGPHAAAKFGSKAVEAIQRIEGLILSMGVARKIGGSRYQAVDRQGVGLK